MHTHDEVNFSTDVEGLDEAQSPKVIRLRDGEVHEIEIKHGYAVTTLLSDF